ncbi:hypothetical protein CG723_22715 [Streptomyces sp. CB01635]|uniref:DUF5988 family protein n=1 Tax=unclassified Streptomyces TaxID=2593676 RepID=UPI000C275F45|nr:MULTISPECIES: DUF5988 family protein [unclassified Streptomyces]PJN09554.1 hypothetical protein CG723_22715 [Streptomyces sp. CB01635]WSE09901.1 DUF5988 family protein [Streptomyces sp. NBC_01445]
MVDAMKAVLEGGPDDLPERIVSVSTPGLDIKVPLRGGYEHFKVTKRQEETSQGLLPVYEWWERTELPG